MSDTTVRLSFPAKADYLLLTRLALGGLARGMAVGPEVLADLKLAVTEAAGNAVRHAYSEGQGSVDVAFVVADDRLEMIVEDHGTGIELPALEELVAKEPEGLAEPHEGGMGMAIIRAIVDELDIKSSSSGSSLRFTKYLA